MRKCPCYKCPKRFLGCHATCKDYHDWQRERKEYLAKIRAEKDIVGYFAQSNISKKDKHWKKKHTRKK